MRSVWLGDSTLQFPGECRPCVGKLQVIFPRLQRLIGEMSGEKRRKLRLNPQVYDRRQIFSSRKDPARVCPTLD